MEGAGAPLYETLVASFPKGLMPEGLEANIQGKIRKRLRDIGYRVVFPANEEWQIVVEYFAIAALDRLHRSFADNPWFWVVSWPSVLGAAAVDFWPEVANPSQRRIVACDAGAAHLESLLISRAFRKGGQALPDAAMKGLRAIGQSTLPALPSVSVDADFNFLLPDGDDEDEEDPTRAALAAMIPWQSTRSQPGGYSKAATETSGGNAKPPTAPLMKAPPPTYSQAAEQPPVQAKAPPQRLSPPSCATPSALPICRTCKLAMEKFSTSAEVYGPGISAVCDECNLDVQAPFFHCAKCSGDLCSDCEIKLRSSS